MKWYVFLLITIPFCNRAQKDTIQLRLSAVQADIYSGIYLPTHFSDQAHFQKLVQNGAFLEADLTGYERQLSYILNGPWFEGMVGGKIFFKKKEYKKIRKEFYSGIRFGQYLNSAAHYAHSRTDTIASYTDPANGNNKYVIRTFSKSYNYSIAGIRAYIPIGINFTSNTDKFFWFSAGFEITPILSFNHKFGSYHSDYISDQVVEEGEIYQGFGGGNAGQAINIFRSQQIKGIGIGLYTGIPLCIYIHPLRKETNGLQRLNFFASLMPLMAFSNDKFAGTTSAYSIVAGTGIRYHL